MNCDIQNIFKNPRYRILNINGEQYLLDMWGSFWKIVFPLFFWLLPNTVFKVEDPIITKKSREQHEMKQPKKVGAAVTVLSGGIAVFLGNLLTPLMDNFDVESTKLINISIIVTTIILVFVVFFYLSRMCRKRLYKMINTERLSSRQLWIRPKSFKHFFQVLFSYFFLLSLTILFFGGFFEILNVIILILAAVLLFLVLISGLLIVIGDSIVVKFRDMKK